MAAWTKAQYDDAYSFRIERYLGGHPNTRPEVKIHYHEYSMGPIMIERWRGILPIITPAITPADFVLVVGAGFGWGVRALKNRIGCAAIGIDESPHIQDEKDGNDTLEISAKITAVGLDPTTGRGFEILSFCRTPGARAKELVLDEDMSTQGSRNRIRNALGDHPTWICVEDIVDDSMTDAEITTLAGHLDQGSAKVFWTYTVTPNRSAQDLATLSNDRVITHDFELVLP